jgi:hypothetical protein
MKNRYILLAIIMIMISACAGQQVKKDIAAVPAATPATAVPVDPKPVPADTSTPVSTATLTAVVTIFPTMTATVTLTPFFVITPSKNDKDFDYYPIHVGNKWYFKGFMKGKDGEKTWMKIKAEIVGTEKKDGKDYYFFYAPKVDIRYLMRKDEKGVYMRVIKYPFPIFNFSIEVNILPEMQIMKYPFRVGEKWTYKGRAEATILGLFTLGRDIRSDFEVIRKEILKTDTGKVEAYHIKVLVNEGDGNPPTTEKYWYGKGTGYTYSDTTGHDAYLVGYKFYDEKTGKVTEKIPEHEEDYK